MEVTEAQLLAVGSLDGRYASRVAELSPLVSEYGLIKGRVAVEIGWLTTLYSGILPEIEPLPDRTVRALERIPEKFTVQDALRVKAIERTTNHDVKAVEYWVKEKIADIPRVRQNPELVHIALTSEDPTNLAYSIMFRDVRDKILVPGAITITEDLDSKAFEFADIPMKSLTHGQPATPTTLGKEMRVFADRLERHVVRLGDVAILGKLNSASGNYNAQHFAYPRVDWQAVSKHFIEDKLGFDFNGFTTQIEPHDWIVSFVNEVAHANSIMLDLVTDMWEYIKDKTFILKLLEGETGSSIMPHKVNPIDFENAEGKFGNANSELRWLADKLPVSRLQRDLSDSTALRAVGNAMGNTLVARKSLNRGMSKVSPNTQFIIDSLKNEWALLMEPLQTVMRKHGITGAYEEIKAVSRGQDISEADYVRLVATIDGLPAYDRKRLLELRPETYIGIASKIARGEISSVA